MESCLSEKERGKVQKDYMDRIMKKTIGIMWKEMQWKEMQ